MEIHSKNPSCISFFSCSTNNNPVDPPIIGKWILTRWEPLTQPPPYIINSCEFQAIHYYQNSGLYSYILPGTQNCSSWINNGDWRINGDSLVVTDGLGNIFQGGKIISLTTTDLVLEFGWGGTEKRYYKKTN